MEPSLRLTGERVLRKEIKELEKRLQEAGFSIKDGELCIMVEGRISDGERFAYVSEANNGHYQDKLKRFYDDGYHDGYNNAINDSLDTFIESEEKQNV